MTTNKLRIVGYIDEELHAQIRKFMEENGLTDRSKAIALILSTMLDVHEDRERARLAKTIKILESQIASLESLAA